MDTQSAIAETRSKIERKNRLEWNEKQIFTSMRSIASSLKDIHDNKLWQDTHESFDEYCRLRLNLTRQRAYQVLNAEDTRLLLSDVPAVADTAKALNDLQASELKGLPKEQAVAVLREAIATPGKMTARKIKEAKARVIEPASVPDLVLDEEATFEQPTPASLPSIVFDYAKIINSLAFLTDEQRAGFFALLGASYCIHCGAVSPCQDCPRHLPFTPANTTA